MEKFLLFSTGAGYDDIQNLDGSEVALYRASDLVSVRPGSIRTIEMQFRAQHGSYDLITLGIKGGQHYKVIRAIGQAIATPLNNNTIISIADMDGYRFIDNNIWSCSIKHQYNDVLKLNDGGIPVEISTNSSSKIQSITFCNTHDSNPANVDIFITDQTGTDIVDTGINANEADNAATIDSVTLTVTGTVATSAVVLNEKIWKSDGTLFGVCTARNSDTEIVFGEGIEQTLANGADLYTGKRYSIVKTDIRPGQTLVLESNDVNFDRTKYKLYINSDSELIDIITRY